MSDSKGGIGQSAVDAIGAEEAYHGFVEKKTGWLTQAAGAL